MKDRVLYALLVGRAVTPERAARFASESRHCPYVALYEATGSTVIGLFVIPPQKRWWIEIGDQPELLGLEQLEVYFPQSAEATSAWSRGEVSPDAEETPCKTDCLCCPQYGERCRGCPAFRHYLGD
jgi:hypothetical protein